MTELSVLDKEKTAEDLQVAREILSSIGSLNTEGLRIDKGLIFIEDKAVSLRNVVVGFRKRGTIDIALAPDGLYMVTVKRHFGKGDEMRVIRSWTGLDSIGVRRQLHRVWTLTA